MKNDILGLLRIEYFSPSHLMRAYRTLIIHQPDSQEVEEESLEGLDELTERRLRDQMRRIAPCFFRQLVGSGCRVRRPIAKTESLAPIGGEQDEFPCLTSIDGVVVGLDQFAKRSLFDSFRPINECHASCLDR